MRFATWLPLFTIIIAFLLSACGDDSTASGGPFGSGTSGAAPTSAGQSKSGGAAKLPNACSLLTPAQVKAQYKFDVLPGEGPGGSKPGDSVTECTWRPVDFQPTFGGVNLTLQGFDKTFFEMTKNSAKDRKDIPGLAEAAFFASSTTPSTLWMKQGDVVYILYVVAANPSSDTAQQAIIALAKNILAH